MPARLVHCLPHPRSPVGVPSPCLPHLCWSWTGCPLSPCLDHSDGALGVHPALGVDSLQGLPFHLSSLVFSGLHSASLCPSQWVKDRHRGKHLALKSSWLGNCVHSSVLLLVVYLCFPGAHSPSLLQACWLLLRPCDSVLGYVTDSLPPKQQFLGHLLFMFPFVFTSLH